MKATKVKKQKSKVPPPDVRYFCLLFALMKGFEGVKLTVQRDDNGYVLLIKDKPDRDWDGPVVGIRVQDDAVTIGSAELDEAGRITDFEIDAEGLPLNDPETLLETLYSIAIDSCPRDEFANAREAFRGVCKLDDHRLLGHYLIDVNVVDIAQSLGLMRRNN